MNILIVIFYVLLGAVYLDDCHVERMIPIFLIVFASISLLRYVISLCQNVIAKNGSEKNKISSGDNLDTLRFFNVILFFIYAFLVVWFILGCVWVYSHDSEVDYHNKFSPSYCHPVVYLCAFWFITIHHIILCFCIFCCPCIFWCCFSSTGWPWYLFNNVNWLSHGFNSF